jgi:DNA-binding transcriptional LysR family regulator
VARMTLQQLKYISEIAKCGSITVAANKLFMAQPSLSKAVKDLEKEFGFEIFERSRHGISFTSDGIEFLQFANRILEQTNAMEEYFQQKDTHEKDLQITISSQHYMFPVDALIKFMKNIATVKRYTLHIYEGKTSEVIHDVLIQKSMIGILYISDITKNFMQRLFAKNNLDFTPFQEFPPYVYISRTHPLASHSSLVLSQLAPYPYIRYSQGIDPYQFSEEIVIPDSYSNKTVYTTDRSTMMSLIAGTDAYTLGSGSILRSVISENVVSVPVCGPVSSMTIGWIKQKNTIMGPELTEYTRCLQESIDQTTWGID